MPVRETAPPESRTTFSKESPVVPPTSWISRVPTRTIPFAIELAADDNAKEIVITPAPTLG